MDPWSEGASPLHKVIGPLQTAMSVDHVSRDGPRRILFAYPEASPPFVNGGIGTYVFEAATLLAQSGNWQVDVLSDSAYGGGHTRRDFDRAVAVFARSGVRLLDLERGRADTLALPAQRDALRARRYYEHVTRLHAERRYQVIESPDWKAPGHDLVRSKTLHGEFRETCLVAHLHSSTEDVARWNSVRPLKSKERRAVAMERYVKESADVILSPSELMLAPLRGGADRPILRCGYPIGRAPDRTSRMESNARPITIACVSRLEPRKGQDLLAGAFRRLRSTRGGKPELQLVFRGVDNFGVPPDRKMSRTIRRILGSTDGWSIVPPQDRSFLTEWLAREVDICVVPSRGDNYPNVVLEAARAGCVIVCSDAGGIPEIVSDFGLDALVFPSGDEAALIEALTSAIARVASSEDRDERAESFEPHRRIQSGRVLATYARIAEIANVGFGAASAATTQRAAVL